MTTPVITTSAEALAPTCFDQLASFNLDMGQYTMFDNNSGMVVLTEGSTCWDSLAETFNAAAAFIEEQLALAASQEAGAIGDAVGDSSVGAAAADAAGDAINDISEEVKAGVEEASGISAIIQEINTYTDKEMMISMYSWDPEDVIAGESVGICHHPTAKPDAMSSCWEWKMDQEGVYEDAPVSYMVNMREFGVDTGLDSATPVSAITVPAMKGSWICAPPTEIMTRMRTVCGRLLPKVDTPEDPMFVEGSEVTVMTYYSSRLSGRTSFPKPVGGEESTGNQGMLSENQAFQEFRMNLSETMGQMGLEGALSSYTTTLVGLVAAVAVLAF